MNVAGTQLHRHFQEIVNSANHRCSAGEIPKAFNIVLTRRRIFDAIGGAILVIANALIQSGRDVLEGSNHQRHVVP